MISKSRARITHVKATLGPYLQALRAWIGRDPLGRCDTRGPRDRQSSPSGSTSGDVFVGHAPGRAGAPNKIPDQLLGLPRNLKSLLLIQL